VYAATTVPSYATRFPPPLVSIAVHKLFVLLCCKTHAIEQNRKQKDYSRRQTIGATDKGCSNLRTWCCNTQAVLLCFDASANPRASASQTARKALFLQFPCLTFSLVYLQQIKKKAKAEGKTCHAKTMLSLEKPIKLL
jgi:hypothetical protein